MQAACRSSPVALLAAVNTNSWMQLTLMHGFLGLKVCCASLQYVHQECLQTWISEKGSKCCEICQHVYQVRQTVCPFFAARKTGPDCSCARVCDFAREILHTLRLGQLHRQTALVCCNSCISTVLLSELIGPQGLSPCRDSLPYW